MERANVWYVARDEGLRLVVVMVGKELLSVEFSSHTLLCMFCLITLTTSQTLPIEYGTAHLNRVIS